VGPPGSRPPTPDPDPNPDPDPALREGSGEGAPPSTVDTDGFAPPG
jgi:hypothetical protein